MTQGSTTNLELTTVEARDTLPQAVTKENFEIIDSYVAATKLTNLSGGSVIAGTVVVPSTLAGCFATTTTANNPKVIGVVQETIANTSSGVVKHYGKTTVRVNGTTGVGDWLVTSSTAGVASPAAQTNPPNGAFAIAISAVTGAGTVDALLLAASVQGSLLFPASTGPTPTTDGAPEWDSNDNYLLVGDGSGQKLFFPDNQGSALTAASTLSIGSDSVYEVNGTTTITGATSNPAGQRVILIMNAATPLTHNATSFILRNGASRVAVPGEIIQLLSKGSGNWVEISTGSTGPKVATADQVVNNSATLVSSTYLQQTLVDSAVYDFYAILIYDAATAADFKVGFTGVVNTQFHGFLTYLDKDSGAVTIESEGSSDILTIGTTPMLGNAVGFTLVCVIQGAVIAPSSGSSASPFAIQFAQNTANSSNATLRAGSMMRLTRTA